MNLPPVRSLRSRAAWTAFVSLIYGVAAILCIQLFAAPGSVALVWLPSGIGLAATVLLGPWAALSAWIGQIWANLYMGNSLGPAIVCTAGSPVAAWVGGTVLLRVFQRRRNLDCVRDVMALIVVALATPLLSATLGTLGLACFGSQVPLLRLWSIWWVGDAMGMLILTPLLLCWTSYSSVNVRRLPEAVLLVLALASFGSVIIQADGHPLQSATYGFLPLTVWAAMRFGQRGAATASFVVFMLGSAAVMSLDGRWGHLTTWEMAVHFYGFVAVTIVTGLMLGASLAERRHSVEALRRNEDLMRKVIDLVPHFIYAKDEDGRFVLANQATAEFNGCHIEDLLGKCDADLAASPSDALRFSLNDREVLASGQPKVIPDDPITRRDGMRREQHTVKIPLELDEQRRAVLSFTMDVTEQRRAEEELRRRDIILQAVGYASQQLMVHTENWGESIQGVLRALGEGSQVSRVYIFENVENARGEMCMSQRHEWVAPGISAELNNPSMQELPYAPLFEPFKVKLNNGEAFSCDVADLPEETHALLEPQGVASLLIVPISVEGKWWGFIGFDQCGERRTWSAAEIDALQVAAGTLGAAIWRRRDEKQRGLLEAQIRHAQKLESLGVLAGGIAHDFNNLLMGVLGNASLALNELPQGHPLLDTIKRIESAGSRAAELTRQMLSYAGKSAIAVQPTQLNEAIEEMIELLQSSISKKARLKIDFHPGLPPIQGDPAQVRQVAMNLILNASDALQDQPGTITVRTACITCSAADLLGYYHEQIEPGNFAALIVRDDGCGMDAATQARIFDPFFTTKFHGRGLGLASVIGIVRSHGGAIRIESAPCAGSTFTVLFPVEAAATVVAAAPAASGDIFDWQASGRVLVVDDEPVVRDVTGRILESCGFEVAFAEDGFAAVRMVEAEPDGYRAVVLDMTMPRMDGEETYGLLRQINARLPILLASGYDAHDRIGDLVDAGEVMFLQKPYRASELITQMRALVEREVEASEPDRV